MVELGASSQRLAEAPFELVSGTVGALPIISRFWERMRLRACLERYLADRGRSDSLPAARTIELVIANLLVAREPLYRLSEWASGFDPAVFGLDPAELALLNDDRVGRALERLFDADRASLLCELAIGVIAAFGVDCRQLHNDSTTITVHGAYQRADGRPRGGKPTPAVCKGLNKDHRPDLKQLVWILTTTADGALPLAHRLTDGNTADDSTHIATWEQLRALTGRADFLYIADSKLCTRPQMSHIDAHGGRFITVLPRSRKEDRTLRQWLADTEPTWAQALRTHPKRARDPADTWSVCPAPIRSTEGYRIVLVHSTYKHRTDQQIRAERLARAQTALTALNTRLQSAKCRLKDDTAVQTAIQTVLHKTHCTELIRHHITTSIHEWTRREVCGHRQDGTPRTTLRRFARTTFTVHWQHDQHAIDRYAATDGCYALITNDTKLSDAEILAAYRYQPKLEQRHHQLKSIQAATPVLLKNPARIEALFTCHFIALLTSALIERHLRQAMTHNNIHHLRLYPEHRPCHNPTTARTLELFAPLTRHHLTHHGHHIQTFPPQPTPLQAHLLDLLDIPTTAYT